MQWAETREFLAPCFPETVRSEMDMLLPGELREIRIRALRPTMFVTAGRSVSLAWAPEKDQLTAMAEAWSEHSLYARSDETGQGYCTLRGGHRMGMCGRVVHRDGRAVLADIGSVCIRIACEWPGCAAPLTNELQHGGSLLLIGPPGSGKTTMLRDIARQLGSGAHPKQVALVDERSELAACVAGIPQLDVGDATDVLDALPKTEAIPWLIRSMSPQYIVTDELGGEQDADALLDAVHAGVSVCASVHGTSLADAASRPALAALMARRVFARYAVLNAETNRIAALHDRSGNPLPLP